MSETNRRYLTADRGTERATAILRQLFRNCAGDFAVRLWDGQQLVFGSPPPAFTLVFRHPHPLAELILFRDPMRLAEAYLEDWVTVEGDLYAALGLRDHFRALRLSAAEQASLLASALLLLGTTGRPVATARVAAARTPLRARLFGRNSRAANRHGSAYHYDVSNEFYALWLDAQMVYSCAYFEDATEDLEQAQRNKLDHLLRKLRLRAGESLLDIGCGWGALVRTAARRYGVRAHGITLSERQYEYARRRIGAEGLQERCTIERKDYRDLAGEAVFDKIVSVGMFEHVGLEHLPRYFAQAHTLLKPGGLFLNHGITHEREGWGRTPGTRFINRYVFPDSALTTVGNVQRVMERVGFEILDVEALRPHYALTLRHWVRRLEARRDEALQHVPERIYRLWRLYMAACALAFEQGNVGVYQILACKKGEGPPPVPLTRRDLYC